MTVRFAVLELRKFPFYKFSFFISLDIKLLFPSFYFCKGDKELTRSCKVASSKSKTFCLRLSSHTVMCGKIIFTTDKFYN